MAYLFTSESVSCGHPDKLCDQISDAILDFCLNKDKGSRVACEAFFKGKTVVVGGEISSEANLNEDALRDLILGVLKESNYEPESLGFNFEDINILSLLTRQSPDISQGVDRELDLGAGDQGLMFGFACSETEAMMPFGIHYAHRLMEKHKEVVKVNNYLKPDAKCQLTVLYEGFVPLKIVRLVFSSQHSESIDMKDVKEIIVEDIIKKIIPKEYLDGTEFLINQTGRFVLGGPIADCGLTGRKIIVDTYGGYARHGGGAFSGKDPTKVDRSGAYMARFLAKTVVKRGLAERCEVQLSYCIGRSEPMSVYVDCFNTEKIPVQDIINFINTNFDLTPKGIIETLDLFNQKYLPTACFGHFGRIQTGSFSWERTDTGGGN